LIGARCPAQIEEAAKTLERPQLGAGERLAIQTLLE